MQMLLETHFPSSHAWFQTLPIIKENIIDYLLLLRCLCHPLNSKGWRRVAAMRNLAEAERGKIAFISCLKISLFRFSWGTSQKTPKLGRKEKVEGKHHTHHKPTSPQAHAAPNFKGSNCWASRSSKYPTSVSLVTFTISVRRMDLQNYSCFHVLSRFSPCFSPFRPFPFTFFSLQNAHRSVLPCTPSQAWLWNAFQSLNTDCFHCI